MKNTSKIKINQMIVRPKVVKSELKKTPKEYIQAWGHPHSHRCEKKLK
jgi:hypothetical protein